MQPKLILDMPVSDATHFKKVGSFKSLYFIKGNSVYKFVVDSFYYVGKKNAFKHDLVPVDINEKNHSYFSELENEEIFELLDKPVGAYASKDGICNYKGWCLELDEDGFYLGAYDEERVLDELGPYPTAQEAFEDAKLDPYIH